MIYELSPSILSADFAVLGEQIRELEAAGARWLHIDVMDGQFVPPVSFGEPVIRSLRPHTGLFFDAHLMVREPIRYVADMKAAGVDLMTVHVEACGHLDRTLVKIRETGMKAGAALNPATPLCTLDYVMDKLDMVLLMTVNPGYGGQSYISEMNRKIRELRRKLDDAGHPEVPIQIDGGADRVTIFPALEAGASIFVAGSKVFRGDIRANTEWFLTAIRKYEAEKKR